MLPPRLPLGDYYQLLQKSGLLLSTAPLHADLTRPVGLVSCDSKTVVPGSLFICKGAAFREEYLREAVKKGACAYVSEREYPNSSLGAACLRVSDVRTAMALLADRAWGHPSGKLKVIGITGTKGKTTAAYYLKSILDAWQAEGGTGGAAILSTILTDDGLERRPSKLTTPEPLELQRHLFNALSAGREYAVMEVSSQALKYGRVLGTEFAVGAFLNIGEDHISPLEHPDFADYFASKLLLFSQSAAACVNLDCARAEEIRRAAAVCPRILGFSCRDEGAQIYADNVFRQEGGAAFRVRTPRYKGAFTLPMPGFFNVENALAALACAEALGVPEGPCVSGLSHASVPGRMETFRTPGGEKVVVVDYAHNGMSLEALLSSVREEYPDRELTVVFGCTGGKGLDRREGMGKAAGLWADRVFLTEDDPGKERVEDICAEIAHHLAPSGKPYRIIPDRSDAVEEAIRTAKAPAVVVLAGKGAEIAQKRAAGPEPYAGDGLLAQRALARYGAV